MADICPKNIECNTYFISTGSENGLIESHVRENSFFSSIIIILVLDLDHHQQLSNNT